MAPKSVASAIHRSVKAGFAYFVLVFALGFVLGTIRVVLLVPRIGELYSVLLELPIVLTASWFICLRLVRRYHVDATLLQRLTMGASAFALLMLGELLLSTVVFGKSIADVLHDYETVHGRLGLGGQVLFAVIPLLQHSERRGSDR